MSLHNNISEMLSQIGAKLKEERISAEMKQIEMAAALGISRQHLSSVEKGQSLTCELLVKILIYLDKTDLLLPFTQSSLPSPIELYKIQQKKKKRVSS